MSETRSATAARDRCGVGFDCLLRQSGGMARRGSHQPRKKPRESENGLEQRSERGKRLGPRSTDYERRPVPLGHRVHENETDDELGVADGQLLADTAADVVSENDRVFQAESRNELVEVARLVGDTELPARGVTRLSIPEQIRCEGAKSFCRQRRSDPSPDQRVRRHSMEQDHRRRSRGSPYGCRHHRATGGNLDSLGFLNRRRAHGRSFGTRELRAGSLEKDDRLC